MKIGGNIVVGTILVGLIFLATSPCHGQGPTTARSLGEVARQLKARREKEKQKPVAVFTNDNLPSRGSLGIASVKLEGSKGRHPEGQSAAQVAATKEHGEKYFRSKAEKIRSSTEFHQRQLAVLKQQFGLAKMQYYPDPQKTLEQESTPSFQKDVDKLRAKIAAAENAIADDQKAMDDLQQELRQERGDPGWIR